MRAYQLHLLARQRSWSHVNQTVCALCFFFGVTLGRSDAHVHIVAAHEPQRLPVVLSGEEIVRFLEAVSGLRNRVALTTAYEAGLRVGEVADDRGHGSARIDACIARLAIHAASSLPLFLVETWGHEHRRALPHAAEEALSSAEAS